MATYKCNHCGVNTQRYSMICSNCSWNNTLYEVTGAPQTILSPVGRGRAVRADDVDIEEKVEYLRTPFENMNVALKGGIVANGYVYLVAGEPGSGKSTLVAQALDPHASEVLYIGVEQPAKTILRRWRELNMRNVRDFAIFCSEDPEEIKAEILVQRRSVVVLDSASKCRWSPDDNYSSSLEAEIVSDMSRFAMKQHEYIDREWNPLTLIIISHVNAQGNIVGQKSKEHDVDCTMKLLKNPPPEDEDGLSITKKKPMTKEQKEALEIRTQLRVLRVSKNRVGGEPSVPPRFLLKGDGFHEFE